MKINRATYVRNFFSLRVPEIQQCERTPIESFGLPETVSVFPGTNEEDIIVKARSTCCRNIVNTGPAGRTEVLFVVFLELSRDAMKERIYCHKRIFNKYKTFRNRQSLASKLHTMFHNVLRLLHTVNWAQAKCARAIHALN